MSHLCALLLQVSVYVAVSAVCIEAAGLLHVVFVALAVNVPRCSNQAHEDAVEAHDSILHKLQQLTSQEQLCGFM